MRRSSSAAAAAAVSAAAAKQEGETAAATESQQADVEVYMHPCRYIFEHLLFFSLSLHRNHLATAAQHSNLPILACFIT